MKYVELDSKNRFVQLHDNKPIGTMYITVEDAMANKLIALPAWYMDKYDNRIYDEYDIDSFKIITLNDTSELNQLDYFIDLDYRLALVELGIL